MKPDEILLEAANLVSGERADQHGDYIDLHKRVADLWGAYLRRPIRPEEVAFCMVLIKIARNEVGGHNPDDGVDATAYSAIWAALADDA